MPNRTVLRVAFMFSIAPDAAWPATIREGGELGECRFVAVDAHGEAEYWTLDGTIRVLVAR